MEQISEYGNVLGAETDQSPGVHRKFYKYDPIEVFPLLRGDMDLPLSSTAAKVAKGNGPASVTDQLYTN